MITNNKVLPKRIYSEVLLKNNIDEQFQSWIFPLNLIPSVFLLPKYCISDNFITPNGRNTNILSIFGVTFWAGILWYHTFSCVAFCEARYNKAVSIFFSAFFLFYSFVLITIFYLNYHHRLKNVELVLHLQCAITFVEFKKFSRERRINWFLFTVATIYYSITIADRLVESLKNWESIFLILTFMFYDFQIFYEICFVKLINTITVLWCDEFKRNVTKQQTYYSVTTCNEIYNSFIHLLDAFKVFKEVFFVVVILEVFQVFLFIMMFAYIIMEQNSTTNNTNYSYNLSIASVCLIFVMKKLLQILTLSTKCEMFYRSIAKIKTLSIKGTLKDSLAFRRTCKKIQSKCRLFKKWDSGFFTVDSKLTYNLLSLVATYFLVLLQFEMMKTKNKFRHW